MKTFYLYDATRLIKTIRAKSLDDADDAISDVVRPELERDCISHRITILTNEYLSLALSDHRFTNDEHTEMFH